MDTVSPESLAGIPHLFDHLPGGVAVLAINRAGELRGIYHNIFLSATLGYDPEEFRQMFVVNPIGLLKPDDMEEFRTRLVRAGETGTSFSRDFRLVRKDGNIRWFRILVNCAGELEEHLIFYTLLTDITQEMLHEAERQAAIAELRLQAELDLLTGIYNRETFCTRTEQMLGENPGEKYVLIRCNVERFKLINDLFGREIGDRILCRLAETLTSIARGVGTYGRLEADHFVICLPKALAFIDVIQHKITAEFVRENLEGGVTVNFGIYETGDSEVTVDQMCDRANLALQTIKGNYLQRHAYYDEILRRTLLQEREILGDMDRALTEHQFEVHFQPIYGITARKAISAEALVRWKHPRRGMMAPGSFIPLFEKNGFIAKLDFYVWEEVCKFQRRRLDAGATVVPVSINVSRLNLHSPRLAAGISKLAARYNLSPSLLPLEITESAYTDDPMQLQKTVAALRDRGFTIYMDDFGSGFSSLNILKDIPFDVIKMDMGFLRGLETSDSAANIITSVVRMAKWLGKPVVAEGVETLEQARFLRCIGCDRIQGYFFSRPVPEKEFCELLDKGRAGREIVISTPALLGLSDDFEELFEGDSLINRLFNSVIGGIGIYELTDDRLEVVRVNDGYYDIMGYSPQSFYKDASNVFSRVTEEDRGPLHAACRQAVVGKGGKEIVIRRRRTNGSEAWLNVKIRFLGERNGHSLICLALTDITGRHSSELVVQQQRKTLSQYFRFLDTLYRTLPCGVVQYTMDDGRWLLAANRAACEIYGYPDEESFKAATGAQAFAAVFPPDREYVDALISAFIKDPRRVDYEYRIKRADGKVAWIKGTLDKMVNVNGKEVIQGVLLDITAEKKEKRTLQVILENLPVGVGIYSVGERLTPLYLSEQTWELFGITHDEYAALQAEGGSFTFMPPPEKFALERLSEQCSELPFEIVFQAEKRDGTPLWLRTIGQARRDENGEIVVYSAISDITEMIAEERRRAKQDEVYKLLLENSHALLFDYSVEEQAMNYSLLTPAKKRVYHSMPSPLESSPAPRVIHPDFREEYSRRIAAAAAEPQRETFEYMADYYGQGYAWYRCVYKSLVDATGKVFRIIGRAYDITAEIEEQNELRAKAATDAMTGLYNRAMTEELINAKLHSAASGEEYALFIIDIDYFKTINDTLGHPTGDKVLKGIAAVLKSQFRSDDIVGRIGGDEFAVLVRTVPDGVHVAPRLEAIIRAVRELSAAMNLGVAFSASIGIALAPRDGAVFNKLFANADIALYRAKQNGRDQGVIFTIS